MHASLQGKKINFFDIIFFILFAKSISLINVDPLVQRPDNEALVAGGRSSRPAGRPGSQVITFLK